MVIDLTRRPIFINTDVCSESIVIRTARNQEVDGILRRTLEPKEYKWANQKSEKVTNHVAEVKAEVEVPHKGCTFMEMRLPLTHILRRTKEAPLPNPYEVATVFRDSFTNQMGTWRAQILIERQKNPNGMFWCITVRDETRKMDLLTATVKALDEGVQVGLQPELLPLQRLRPDAGPERLTIWDRLRVRAVLGDD